MDITYANIEDCFDLVPSLTEPSKDLVRLESALQQNLIDASRQFELETFVGVNYYAKAPAVATDRPFLPNGSAIYRLPPYVGAVVVKDADNELIDVDDFVLDGQYLKFIRYSCDNRPSWFRDKIILNARWGFECVPATVKTAVKNWGCLNFLTSPLNRLGVDGGLSDELDARLRNNYNRILEEWRYINKYRQLGVG